MYFTESHVYCSSRPSPVLTQPSASRPAAAGGEQPQDLEPQKPKKNRCFMCRKKLGLTGKTLAARRR